MSHRKVLARLCGLFAMLAVGALAGCQSSVSEPGTLVVADATGSVVAEQRLAVKDEPGCLALRDSLRTAGADSALRAAFVATCVVEIPPGAPKPPHPLPLPEFRCDFARVLLDSGHSAVIPGVRDHCPELCAALAVSDSAVHARQCVKPVPPPIPSTPLSPARCVEVLVNLEKCEDNVVRQNDQCALNAARQDSVCVTNTARQDSTCATGAARQDSTCLANAARADGNCEVAVANQAAQCDKIAARIAAECAVDKPHCKNLRTQLQTCGERVAARAAECTLQSRQRASKCAEGRAHRALQCTENSTRRTLQCAESSARRAAQCAEAAGRREGNCERPRQVLEIRCTDPVAPIDSVSAEPAAP